MNANLSHLISVAQKPERLIVGLMSGTSLDGLDIALCKLKGAGQETEVSVLAFKTCVYPEAIKNEIRLVFAQKTIDLQKLTLLHGFIAEYHAKLVLETLEAWKIAPKKVDILASHGQTIYHAPAHFHQKSGYGHATLQLGDGDILAAKTGILTLSDFRQKHIAFGGEGAPLAIYGDFILFSSTNENRLLLNLGGIANVTYLPQNGKPDQVLASDLAPANTLMDQAAKKYLGVDFDQHGAAARLGTIHQKLLQKLLAEPFISESLPKSTGPELFTLHRVEELLKKEGLSVSANDLLATLHAFTVAAIAQNLAPFCQKNTVLYASGGGVHNTFLMEQLQKALPSISIKMLTDLGIHPDAKEAVLFAILANETLAGEPTALGNMPAFSMGKISFPR